MPEPISVNILATPRTSLSTLFGLADVLGSVGSAWETFVTGEPSQPLFDVRIVATEREAIQCANGVIVSPDLSLTEADRTDVAIVASFVMPATVPPKDGDPRELDWLLRQHAKGATIASACTGAVMIAQSGLLNGWIATTHWAYRDMFRRHFPEVQLHLEKDICVSGNNGSLVTAGGNTSWQELALYLTARYFGAEHASNTAKFWRLYNQERNQAAYMAIPQGMPHNDSLISDCQKWISLHYMRRNPINEMVAQSGLAPTSFTRRFIRAVGHRPMEYVHGLRIDKAKAMLEKGQDLIDEIGREVGYEDPASFRQVFKRKTGLTPSEYRRRFSHRRFATSP